jgi:uncharacterized membrane protein
MFKERVLPRIKALSKRWFIDAFGGMAHGLFATLIIGTIIEQIGKLFGDNAFGMTLQVAGKVAKTLMGAGIGAGIAHSLKANRLIIFAAAVAGTIGAFAGAAYGTGTNGFYGILSTDPVSVTGILAFGAPGNPIGAYFAAIISVEVASLVAGKTKLDIILLPFITVTVATAVAVLLCPPVISAVNALGKGIAKATELQPFFMGIVVSVVMGLLLTLPTSSAAMWAAIAGGAMAADPSMRLAGGAAVVGCAAHMVGFAVASFRENRFGGLISQGVGTSMLQIPNLMRKPVILVPAIVASAIVGPLSTCVFKLYCTFEGGGMGTSGLVGVISTVVASNEAGRDPVTIFFGIALLFFVIPAAVAFLVSELMRKKGIIKLGDMKI